MKNCCKILSSFKFSNKADIEKKITFFEAYGNPNSEKVINGGIKKNLSKHIFEAHCNPQ